MKYSNIEKRLALRRSVHVCTSRETKVVQRWGGGGYKAPGSLSGRKSFPKGRGRR